ncbi:D-alanine--D-alanine ligase [uncultured Imperialibacter sp.]|uniref:D-alanine--D-alanine ligase family protein n=1 Tax=uncultured Imperialibacter sp. TaxID=1672639 RepID=UPI0030D92FFF
MRVGIFFGGQSREREISFAGGRTVYDNLNKSLFEPVLFFIDSLGQIIELNWQYVYKGTIRDFYPPVSLLPPSPHHFQVYIESLAAEDHNLALSAASHVGRKVSPEELPTLIDFAFLALHGPFGEDGNIQGLLEWYNIPYSGSGILPSAIGVNKVVQKDLLEKNDFSTPAYELLNRDSWLKEANKKAVFDALKSKLKLPLVIKAPNQGSTIGVAIIDKDSVEDFVDGMNRAFFIEEIELSWWAKLPDEEKRKELIKLTDIREGIGLPVMMEGEWISHPEKLWVKLDQLASAKKDTIQLTSQHAEETVLVEAFIKGREFSCIVIENDNGAPMALPPTEIRKIKDLFDYRSKYLPGISRKITPIELPDGDIQRIREQCERLFTALHCQVYARIDGFYTEDGGIFLNDPNTTSGMLPSSFFFHQAAEIGLNPSQFLTYIIRTSLAARIKTGKMIHQMKGLLKKLDTEIQLLAVSEVKKINVGVIMGGFSSERHISVESGRNIFEKLASSTKYHPVPIFLTGNEENHELYLLPVNIMLKDNADDIREKLHAAASKNEHPVIGQIKSEAGTITSTYAPGTILKYKRINYEDLSGLVDAVFIALHGRPGEDGAVQVELEKLGIPYNGSGVDSSRITINKYETNELLMKHGISVANHTLVYKEEYLAHPAKTIAELEKSFTYPLIAKPADDGCSSAVKKIRNQQELCAFAEMMFRDTPEFLPAQQKVLKLKDNEEFPQKSYFLLEDLIDSNGATHFLEITGGMLTSINDNGDRVYELFEPSETLATGDVLSLEEKFLAGEGQNITPARFGKTPEENKRVSEKVRKDLEKVAEILNIEGYARIDAFVRIYEDGKVETIIIEINSLPGMTPATCIFHQSAINGYKPYEFIDAILTYGMQRQKLIA